MDTDAVKLPCSFVQVHYHNKTGGVSTVIRRYAEAFARIRRGERLRNIWICADKGTLRDSGDVAEIVHVPECDYRTFTDKKSFFTARDRLRQKLDRFILGLPRPVCVVGHNLSLGKNCALSAAFSAVARKRGRDPGFRFHSVIHDLAEEGRVSCMQQIRALGACGLPVERYLYPVDRVTIVVLNQRNLRLFRRAGFDPVLLPDPVTMPETAEPLTPSQRAAVTRGLRDLARRDATAFDPRKETCFYPVRILSRKNIFEAVIVACIIRRANLIIGGPGTSAEDRRLFAALQKLTRRNNLPVIYDCERLREVVPANMTEGRASVFHLVYRYADLCISTSVSEGFGYALFEPWLYGKQLIGRLPKGIGPHEIADLSRCYTRLSVPAAWVPLRQLRSRYLRALEAAFGTPVCRDPAAVLVRGGTVDFGALDRTTQAAVTGRMIASGSDWIAAIRRSHPAGDASAAGSAVIGSNARRLEATLSSGKFDRMMTRRVLCRQVRGGQRRPPDRGYFACYFASAGRFSLLMAPGS